MNINPSQFSRTTIGLFFVLFFPGITQANVLQKMARSLPDIPQSKVEEVFNILEDVGVSPSNEPGSNFRVLGHPRFGDTTTYLYQDSVRQMVHALDDPVSLIKPLNMEMAQSRPYIKLRYIKIRFFFARFDFYKDSDTLFTKLFATKSGSKLLELPFEEAKRNWENFLGAVKNANDGGYAQITETDLEAAAMSFIHQRFSDTYFPWSDSPSPSRSSNVSALSRNWQPISPLSLRFGSTSSDAGTIYWDEQSLGAFFHNQFNIGHYMSPHFTLTPEDFYHRLIMGITLSSLERRALHSTHMSIINSKNFVLRIWNDAIVEINKQEGLGISSHVFLERIVNSISSEDQTFLKALVEAAREDDRLAKLVGIVYRFATDTGSNLTEISRISRTAEDAGSNLENYRQNFLRQFRDMPSGSPTSEIDQLIYSFLSRPDLEEFVLQQVR